MSDPGRRFEIALRISAAVAAASALLGLSLGATLGAPALLLTALAVLAYMLNWRPPLGPRAWFGVQLGFIAFLTVAGVLWRVHVLVLFGWLLLFVLGHRLLTRVGPRDEIYVVFIGFGQLLLSSILTLELAFLAAFLLFAVSATWALLLARVALAAAEEPAAARNQSRADLRDLLRPTAVLVVMGHSLVLLLGTAVIFFLLPRFQSGLGGGILPPIPTSGFTDRVRLGSVGTMQLSDEPVLRARFWDATGRAVRAPVLHWKGLALDHFDGRAWSLGTTERTTLLNRTSARDRGPPQRSGWSLRVDVDRENLDTSALFVIDELYGLYTDARSMEAAATDGYFRSGPAQGFAYTMYVAPQAVDPDALRRTDPGALGREELQRLTSLPEGLDPRIPALAEEWAGGASTAFDAALLIRQRLVRDYAYSLDQVAGAARDPLAAFLFDVKEGHCEYFATAMAVLLRSRGVPARVVNGFLGGDWNPVGEYLVVRQRHAHAWVEVEFPGQGWRTFDPTPSAGAVDLEARLSFLGRLAAWSDVTRVAWGRVMLEYGLDQQGQAVREGLRWVGGWGGEAPALPELSAPTPPRRVHPALALLAGIVALAALVVFAMPRRPREPPASRVLLHLLRAWERASRQLGVPGPAVATPLAWARWAASAHPAWEDAPALVGRFYAVRWGRGADPALVRDLRRLPRRPRLTARTPPRTTPGRSGR